VIKGKNQIANISNMELKNVNMNCDNIVASNPINVEFIYFSKL
jgi:hypothetical protein